MTTLAAYAVLLAAATLQSATSQPLAPQWPAPKWWAVAPPGPPTDAMLHDGRWLVGTESGLYREADASWALVLTRGGVRDLARGPERALIATASGLYEWPQSHPEPRALRLGAGARVAAVAVDESGTEWAASEVGLFARSSLSSEFLRRVDIPAGEVVSVRTLGEQVWAASRRALWLRDGDASFKRRLHGLEEGWWELRAVAGAGAASLLCVPEGIWRVSGTDARRVELGLGELHSIAVLDDTLWVAAERGVYALELGSWESGVAQARLDSPALSLTEAESTLVVTTRDGIASIAKPARLATARTGRPLPAPPTARLPQLHPGRRRLDIDSVRRAVLAYLELSPGRLGRVEARAQRAGWLPQLRAGLSLDRNTARDRDHDEVLSSGSVRDLLDNARKRDRGLEFDLQLTWEFARLASPDDALDVSRERRQLIELRDQVLERVNRLYFERERVLTQLAAAPEAQLEPEHALAHDALQLRARELTALLDGWTGGLLSRLESGADDSPDSPWRIR